MTRNYYARDNVLIQIVLIGADNHAFERLQMGDLETFPHMRIARTGSNVIIDTD